MRLSSRLRWELRPNAISLLLERKRQGGAPVLDLTESNPTRAGFSYDSEAILGALSDPGALRYDPHPAGVRAAREAVAEYYACRGERVNPDQVVLTSGTSEAYGFLFKLLADPGDVVLTPRPSYPLFEFLAALESTRVRQYPLILHGSWGIDFEAIRQAKAVVVVNPNNPTGNFVKSHEVEALTRLCADDGIAIICDEVFFDFGFSAGRGSPTTGVDDVLCFTLNGLSKVAGLPQMKLAWIVVTGPEDQRREAIARLELISDTYLSVGTPVQCAAARLLDTRAGFQKQALERIAGNLGVLRSDLGCCSLLPVEGGWYAVLRLPQTLSEEEWALAFLERDDVLTQPGYFYDFEAGAHIVVSLITETGVFREGIRRVLASVREAVSP